MDQNRIGDTEDQTETLAQLEVDRCCEEGDDGKMDLDGDTWSTEIVFEPLSEGKSRVPQEYHQMVAVWSSDKTFAASEIIPILSQCSQVVELYDKWKRQHKEWVGFLVFYQTVPEAYSVANMIPNLIVGGSWPLKALNVGQFLQFVANVEESLEPELRDQPTMLSIGNLPYGTPIESIKGICEDFGRVVSVEEVREQPEAVALARFLVSFTLCCQAYAAYAMLDCRKELETTLEVKIVQTKKIALIHKEALRKDMLLWGRC